MITTSKKTVTGGSGGYQGLLDALNYLDETEKYMQGGQSSIASPELSRIMGGNLFENQNGSYSNPKDQSQWQKLMLGFHPDSKILELSSQLEAIKAEMKEKASEIPELKSLVKHRDELENQLSTACFKQDKNRESLDRIKFRIKDATSDDLKDLMKEEKRVALSIQYEVKKCQTLKTQLQELTPSFLAAETETRRLSENRKNLIQYVRTVRAELKTLKDPEAKKAKRETINDIEQHIKGVELQLTSAREHSKALGKNKFVLEQKIKRSETKTEKLHTNLKEAAEETKAKTSDELKPLFAEKARLEAELESGKENVSSLKTKLQEVESVLNVASADLIALNTQKEEIEKQIELDVQQYQLVGGKGAGDKLVKNLGTDICFSPDKTFSLLVANTKDEKLRGELIKLFMESVKAEMDAAQKRGVFLGERRNDLGGKDLVAGECGWTAYLHSESRACINLETGEKEKPSPQIHAHCFLANVIEVKNPDGTTDYLNFDNERLEDQKKMMDRGLQLRLDNGLRDLGIQTVTGIDKTSKLASHVEIAGLQDYKSEFSPRTQNAEQYALEKGIDIHQAALELRLPKGEESFSELQANWIKKADEFYLARKAEGHNIVQLTDEGLKAAGILGNDPIEALDPSQLPDPEFLLTQLYSTRICKTEIEIREYFLAAHIGTGATPDQVNAIVDNVIQNIRSTVPTTWGELEGGQNAGKQVEMFTPLHIIKQEVGFQEALLNRDTFNLKIDEMTVLQEIDKFEKKNGYPLSTCQKNALMGVLSGFDGTSNSKSPISIINGLPGTGKSTAAEILYAAIQATNEKNTQPEIHYLALGSTNAASKELRDAVNKGAKAGREIEGKTLHAFLLKLESSTWDEQKQAFIDPKGKVVLSSNTILHIDESSMTGTQEGYRLFTMLNTKLGDETGIKNVKVILQGDRNQIQSVAWGNFFKDAYDIVKNEYGEANIHTLETVNRQTNDTTKTIAPIWMKDQIITDDVKRVIAMMKEQECLKVGETLFDAKRNLIEDVMKSEVQWDQKIIIAYLNEDIDAINRSIQRQRQEQEPTQGVKILSAGKTDLNREMKTFHLGDRVALFSNSKEDDLVKTQQGTVIGFIKNEKGVDCLQIKMDGIENPYLYDPTKKNPMRLDLGYAISVNNSQGMSKKEVSVLWTDHLAESRYHANVAITRMKDKLNVYTDLSLRNSFEEVGMNAGERMSAVERVCGEKNLNQILKDGNTQGMKAALEIKPEILFNVLTPEMLKDSNNEMKDVLLNSLLTSYQKANPELDPRQALVDCVDIFQEKGLPVTENKYKTASYLREDLHEEEQIKAIQGVATPEKKEVQQHNPVRSRGLTL